MTKPKAKILSSKLVYKGSVFNVRRDRVSEPGGVLGVRDVVTHPGSVVVMPVFDDGSVLLIRQYRHAASRFLWELVAGRIEPGESLAEGARRELGEEAGYTARRMKKLLEFFPSPGVMTEIMWVFVATGLTRGVATPEEDERITSRRFSVAAVLRMIEHGTIQDAKTISSMLFYSRFGR
jgi:ADP-ribose pyrophosphatase